LELAVEELLLPLERVEVPAGEVATIDYDGNKLLLILIHPVMLS